MTDIDRFDPFERRITDAIAEIAAARGPAYLDDVLRLTARTSQRRSPALLRFPSLNRLSYLAAAATIVALVGGGALLLRSGSNRGGPPSPSPTPTSIAPAATALAPESLRSTWIAYAGPAASSGGSNAFVRLVVSAKGDKLSVFVGGTETLLSSPIASPTTEFDLVSTSTAGGCKVGDIGRYGFAFGTDGTLPASDGTLLVFNPLSDDCAARSEMLYRGWTHAIDAANSGGRGISAAFTPMFLITLPAAGYVAQVGIDSLTLTSATPDRTMIAVKNPVGWTDPCSSNGGAKLPIAPTIRAFTAYLRTLPGLTVNSADLAIDGYPAVLLTIPSVQSADCSSHRVNVWTAGAGDGTDGWLLNQGDTDVVYLVEVDGNLILLQWLGAGVTRAEEQALLTTVRFTSSLPQ